MTERDFVVERVLEKFEVPLLEVVRSGEQLYLRKWASTRVWLYTRVTQENIDRYMRGDVPLYDVMASCDEGLIEVEIDNTPIWDLLHRRKRWLDYLPMHISMLPKNWLPTRDACHDVDLEPEERT